MILVPDEEEKLKENNQRRKHAEKVVDSAMNVAGEIVGRSNRPQGNNQQGGNILDAAMQGYDQNASQDLPDVGQQGITETAMQGYNPDSPFSSSIMPTVSSMGTTVPTYNVNEVLGGGRMESTEAPVRDAAAYERNRQMQKFNAISKGLQAVFGGFVASQGEVAPGPYESGMTQQLMQNLQGLDDKYFREMAEWRDRELRTEMHNANLDARDDQIRLQKMREDAQALRDQKRYDEAQALEAEAQEYARGMDNRRLSLMERSQAADEVWRESQGNDANRAAKIQTLRAYETQYDDLQKEWETASENFNEEDAKRIKMKMDQNMKIREQLMKQLSDREGFEQEGEPKQSIEEFRGQFRQSIGLPSKEGEPKTESTSEKPKDVQAARQKFNTKVSSLIEQGTASTEDMNELLSIPGVNERQVKSLLLQNGVKIPEEQVSPTRYRW